MGSIVAHSMTLWITDKDGSKKEIAFPVQSWDLGSLDYSDNDDNHINIKTNGWYHVTGRYTNATEFSVSCSYEEPDMPNSSDWEYEFERSEKDPLKCHTICVPTTDYEQIVLKTQRGIVLPFIVYDDDLLLFHEMDNDKELTGEGCIAVVRHVTRQNLLPQDFCLAMFDHQNL